MKLEHVTPGMLVRYIPRHAHGNRAHRDVEYGVVSSTNHLYAFVRFDRQVAKFGWGGATSQSCDPGDLEAVT